MTISADLGLQLETFVSGLVASGRFNSPEAVLREAVRQFQEREERLSKLDAAIERGLADADAGRVRLAKDVFDELEARHPVLATVVDR
jgi:antitoxin ParD1/3/4